MSISDGVFNNLRQRLDEMGYAHTLPSAAIPLVGALFEDLIKTTESLRDAKKKLVILFEEKSYWELSVEPYKCDNSRLLAECNKMHLKALKEREEFEDRICELNRKIRNYQNDKQHLKEHSQQLHDQLQTLRTKENLSGKLVTTTRKFSMDNTKKLKKPFITTIRSGNKVSASKCNPSSSDYHLLANEHIPSEIVHTELQKVENTIADLTEQVAFCEAKIESRNHEIRRLNDLLLGGRPISALVKDCCYKNVRTLTEDLELLNQEKTNAFAKIHDYQNKMHEAMQRAVLLDKCNRQLQQELDELKEAALQIENEANFELAERENEIQSLQLEVKKFRNEQPEKDKTCDPKFASNNAGGGDSSLMNIDKTHIIERLNALRQKETVFKHEKEYTQKKISKLKTRIICLEKDLKKIANNKRDRLDEEKIRLKSDRDFYQTEYLRLQKASNSKKEIESLQLDLKSKENEIRDLRAELYHQTDLLLNSESQPLSARSEGSNTTTCVQATILRIERERDCTRKELQRVLYELNILQKKHIDVTKKQAEETVKWQRRIDELRIRLKQLELHNQVFHTDRSSSETQVVTLKKEIEVLKNQLFSLHDENCKLKSSYNQLKVLNEQNERSLMEYQDKILLAEGQLEMAGQRLKYMDSNTTYARQETTELRHEIASLRNTFLLLEKEKDKIMLQLDIKTKYANQLEHELRNCKDRRDKLEDEIKDLQEHQCKASLRAQEGDVQLKKMLSKNKHKHQEITALVNNRDLAIEENERLSNDLAKRKAEIVNLKKKIRDSDCEIDRLKQQLWQYVQEVKKAEDLLLHKETEREEMLDHYRSLSHDAVLLEGNNQSLEVESVAQKRQICELEIKIEELQKKICYGSNTIQQLEGKITILSSQNNNIKCQLHEAYDNGNLLQEDLAARKELCIKLDNQKDKLNKEVEELNQICRKLQRDNEMLRNDQEKTSRGEKVNVYTLEELLKKTRSDLQEQLRVDHVLTEEISRLREENEILTCKLQKEREKCTQGETIVHEYHARNEELQHNITDDRFCQARIRDLTPRYPH